MSINSAGAEHFGNPEQSSTALRKVSCERRRNAAEKAWRYRRGRKSQVYVAVNMVPRVFTDKKCAAVVIEKNPRPSFLYFWGWGSVGRGFARMRWGGFGDCPI